MADLAAIARANAKRLANSPATGPDGGGKVRHSTAEDAELAQAQRQFAETERAYGGRAAYDKAKAAGKTKLNYGQWVQVRTPNFKAWFGDWEAVRAQQRLKSMNALPVQSLPATLANDSLREEAKRIYNKAAEMGPITTADGREVQLTAIGFKKTRFHSADRRVLDLLGSIREVLGNAVPVASLAHEQENPSDSIRAWHYYGAKVNLNGKELFAKLVVRESVNGQIYYDNDLSSVEEISGRAGDAAQNKPEAAAVSADKRTLAELVASGNPDEVSKVVDPATGEPLVVYHGTDADFSKFEKEYQRAGQYGGQGFFFTGQPEVAGRFGSSIMPVFLSAKTGLLEKRAARVQGKEVQIDHIRPKDDSRDIWAVFTPTQIKSATGNRGTFDPANPDIRYSRAAQPQPIQQPVAQTAWQSPAASKFDDFVYKLQDKHIDPKRVVQAVKDAKNGIADGNLSKPTLMP